MPEVKQTERRKRVRRVVSWAPHLLRSPERRSGVERRKLPSLREMERMTGRDFALRMDRLEQAGVVA